MARVAMSRYPGLPAAVRSLRNSRANAVTGPASGASGLSSLPTACSFGTRSVCCLLRAAHELSVSPFLICYRMLTACKGEPL